MMAKRVMKLKAASGGCTSCGNGMIRNVKERYCPRCGHVEEDFFDGI